MNENSSNPALAVYYEPIELHSHYTYKKKSFIDKLRISNPNSKDSTSDTLFTEGFLIIELSNKRLLFRPHEPNLSPDLIYYQESFHKKLTIELNNIKNLIFLNKNNEYVSFKTSSSIVKSYNSFMIMCYDFRVYRYNRVSIYNKNEAIKFYQEIFRSVFETGVERLKYIMWVNISHNVLREVYYRTVNNSLGVRLKTIKKYLVVSPVDLSMKDFKDTFEFGPQLVYYSDQNNCCLIVIDKLSGKKCANLLRSISKIILGLKFKQPVLFQLNCENSENKSEFYCPTNKELMESFEKLYILCTPRDKAEFKKRDKKWLSKQADCGWLNLVNRCLQLTKIILKSMSEPWSSVYLMEQGYPVWGWLFGSLVQIICQPIVRTKNGFLSMIEKNWIISSAFNSLDGPRYSLFLLFLDCVYQLIRSSPFLFEFNEEMLIFLYDLFILAPPGFVNSLDYDFRGIDWSVYFVDQVLDCLENHYYLEESFESCLYIPKVDVMDFDSFWFKMYARWIPYVQIESGSMSIRHFFMVVNLNLENLVYTNYPFSLNYDKITMNSDYNNIDDTRSINTMASDD